MSSEDIDKGGRWVIDIAKELGTTSFGILCVTPDNIDSPWLNFEAGALSKALDTSRVTPLLLGVRPTDLQGPLAQFQATLSDKDDIWKLVTTLNRHGGPTLEDDRLRKAFAAWWPELEAKLKRVASEPVVAQGSPHVDTAAVLQEILILMRSQQQMLATMTAASGQRAVVARDGKRIAVRKNGTRFHVEHDEWGGDITLIRAGGFEDAVELLSHLGISSGMFEWAIKRLRECEDGGGVLFYLLPDGPVMRNLIATARSET